MFDYCGTFSKVQLNEMRIGSKIMIKGNFGQGQEEPATVTNIEEDIKNGKSGIDYVDEQGNNRWAYLYQVQKVIKY